MPPEGYEAVTLPVGVVERLDNIGGELNNPSRASIILTLLDAYNDDPSDNGVELGDLREQLDRIESAASTAEERTGSIENTLENMGGR